MTAREVFLGSPARDIVLQESIFVLLSLAGRISWDSTFQAHPRLSKPSCCLQLGDLLPCSSSDGVRSAAAPELQENQRQELPTAVEMTALALKAARFQVSAKRGASGGVVCSGKPGDNQAVC